MRAFIKSFNESAQRAVEERWYPLTTLDNKKKEVLKNSNIKSIGEE